MTDTPPRLLLLGPALWCAGGAPIPLAAERPWQLLAWLGHHCDWVPREQLATLLWPEHGTEAARRNLRKVLFRLRQNPQLPVVEEQAGRLRWAVDTDLRAFDAALERGDREAALALWRGEPWQGLGAEGLGALGDWLAFERTRLRARWRAAALQACDAATHQDDLPGAARHAQALLDADALDEEALRALLRALYAQRRTHEATAAYALFARSLAATLGLEPSAETRALLAAPAKPVHAAAPTAADASPFIGRRSELRELAALLSQPGCAWVTLVGAGGTGKTRLLQQALPTLAGDFADGAAWVPFEDVHDTALAATRLAEVLHLAVQAQTPVLVQIAQHLAGQQLLLALDNLEHLQPAAVDIATALATCPGVRVIASSRMRLGVPGEWLLPVPGLPWPSAEDLDRAETFDAVRLFNTLARTHRPGFDGAAEAAAVVKLCAAVEGLPLALTLAAVWTRQFSVSELVQDLQRGAADVLRTAKPGAPARQLSMEACLEHSWQLLVPAERQVLMRLTVFRGDFTVEAAHHVAGASLPLLAALVDKSLVQRIPDELRRHALHPLTADFARRRMDAPSQAAAEHAHADYFLQQLARYAPPERAAERAAFYAAMAADEANLVQAWHHACTAGMADALAAATVGFVSHLHARAQFSSGLSALRCAEPVLDRHMLARARLQCAQALLALNTGEFAYAHEVSRAALPVVRRARDSKLVRICLDHMAMALLQTGHYTEARRRFVEQLRQAERQGDKLMAANTLHGIAMIDSDAGRHERALAAQRRAMALRSELGDTPVLIAQELGQMLRVAGQPQRAVHEMNTQLASCNAQTLGHERSMLLGRLAAAELDLGEFAAADAHVQQALAVNNEGVLPMWDVTLALLCCRIHIHGQRGDAAWQHLRRAAPMVRRADAAPLTRQFALHAALWLRGQGRENEAGLLLAALLRQPGLDQATRREARALLGRSPPAAPGTVPELMPLIDGLLPLA